MRRTMIVAVRLQNAGAVIHCDEIMGALEKRTFHVEFDKGQVNKIVRWCSDGPTAAKLVVILIWVVWWRKNATVLAQRDMCALNILQQVEKHELVWKPGIESRCLEHLRPQLGRLRHKSDSVWIHYIVPTNLLKKYQYSDTKPSKKFWIKLWLWRHHRFFAGRELEHHPQ